MQLPSRWDEQLRVLLSLMALALTALAYRDHFLTGRLGWWRWLVELAIAVAILIFALRGSFGESKEGSLRKWLRRAVLASSAAALAVAIHYGLQRGQEVRAAIAVVGSLILFVLGRWRPRTAQELSRVTGAEQHPLASIPMISWIVGIASVLLVVVATWVNMQSPIAGAALWATAVLALAWSARRADRQPQQPAVDPITNVASDEPSVALQALLLALILALAAVLRFAQVGDIPVLIDADEGRHGSMSAIMFSQGFPNLFDFGWNSFSNGATLVQSIFLPWMGRSWVQIRMSSALMGTLAVLVTFLWVRRWWGAFVGLIAAYLLAINQEHLYWSRVGYNNIQATVVAGLLLLSFARALQRGRWRDYVALGYAVGLAFYTYHAAKLYAALLLPPTLLLAFDMPLLVRRHLGGAVVAVVAFLMFVLPQAPSISENWSRFRTDTTNRFDTYELAAAYNRGDSTAVRNYLYTHFADSLNVFLSVPHNLSLFEKFVAIPFMVGVFWLLWQWREPRHTYVLMWLAGLLLIGSMLCSYPPNKPRLLGVIPMACVIPAILAGQIRSRMRRGFGERADWVAVPLLILWMAAAAYGNWYTQFVYMASLQRADSHSFMCRKLMSLPLPAVVYVVGGDTDASALHALDDCSSIKPDQMIIRQLAMDGDVAPLPPQSAPYAVVFISRFQPDMVPLFRHYYPDARVEIVEHPEGGPLMYTFTFDGDALNKKRGLTATFRDATGKSWSARSSFADQDLPAFVGPAEVAYPVEAHWQGLVWIENEGAHHFDVSAGAVEVGWPAFVDPAPPADRSPISNLLRGWQPIRIDATLAHVTDKVALSWVRPGDTTTIPVPRTQFTAHVQPSAVLGRYYEAGFSGPSDKLVQQQLHGAINFDWPVLDDTRPPDWFMPRGSKGEWVGTVDLPIVDQPVRLEATNPTQLYINDRLVLDYNGDRDVELTATLSEPPGRAKILVRSTRPADDRIEHWKVRVLWGDGAGSWTSFANYQPPLE